VVEGPEAVAVQVEAEAAREAAAVVAQVGAAEAAPR
jgi:hypothetical protein